jgi:hypothetical protein
VRSGTTSGDSANHDNQVRDFHNEAVARGEKRVLCRTTDGRLYSYARDEIGVVTASSHPTVRSAGGLIAMAVFFAALAVFSIMLVAAPTGRDQDPMWGALVLTAAGVGGVVYATRLAGKAYKAKRVRAERGIPEPTSRQFD